MIGEVIDSKYRIDRELGAGGMGNVYLATHLGTTRVVAVKVIAPKWAREPQFLARFQREAQACGRLRHPNIVNVTDFGIAKSDAGDLPYLVMEYLDGQTLSEFQKSNPAIPLTLIADILDQVALALNEAHRQGIVHRDLKPDNIWLEPNGRGGYAAKVLDFGVAKLNLPGEWAAPIPAGPVTTEDGTLVARPSMPVLPAEETETIVEAPAPPPPPKPAPDLASVMKTRAEDLDTVALAPAASSPGLSRAGSGSGSAFLDSSAGAQTMPGSLLGTPAYMSPEQAFGKEIDFRSDIYSLAVVAYSLACGQLPFVGRPSELFEYHERGTTPPPKTIAKIPADVSDAILTGLARNPLDRPASAVEFARRVHNAVDAEFLALRRSKAFVLQHLMPFAVVMMAVYGTLLSIVIPLIYAAGKSGVLAVLGVNVVNAMALIFADNVIRAAAAMMAVEEQSGIRRFLGIRVLWRLVKRLPMLVRTQFQVGFFFGPGWLVLDCLWPTVAIAENLRGRAAALRSRELMTGLQSAGRALAIRHCALPMLTIAQAVPSALAFLHVTEAATRSIQVSALWFPWFAAFSAAPLFLYDRTAASEKGPLLQLDRTPEVRLTTRALSMSSILWLVALAVYLVYGTAKTLVLGK